MKKAIERAIRQGFDPVDGRIDSVRLTKDFYGKLATVEFRYICLLKETDIYKGGEVFRMKSFDIYRLLFATDFIDKLVREGNPDCGCYRGRCERADCQRDHLINPPCKGKHDGDWCKYLMKWEDADYHRRELANMKDIEKIKEYINRLA